jgi:hypothetical protein
MSWLMFGLRYVLPVAVVLGGGIVMALGGENNLIGGAGIVGAGLAVYAVNWFYRVAVSGDVAREEEEAARTYFDVHGHWPDEASPAGSSGRASSRRSPAPATPVAAAQTLEHSPGEAAVKPGSAGSPEPRLHRESAADRPYTRSGSAHHGVRWRRPRRGM